MVSEGVGEKWGPMFAYVRRWLTTPVFADEDEKRVAAFLNTLFILVLVLCTLVIASLIVFVYPEHQARLHFVLSIMVLAVVARYLLRRWQLRVVSAVIMVVSWALAIVTIIRQGGVTAPLYSFFAIVALAPFTVGRWTGIGFALLTVVTGLALIPLADRSLLPPPEHFSPLVIWLFFSSVLVFVAIVLEIIARQLTDSLRQARQSRDSLQFANQFHRLITDLALDFINMMPNEVDAGVRKLLQRVAEFVGADNSVVMMLAEDEQFGSCLYEWHHESLPSLARRLQQVPVAEFPWLMGQLRRLKSIWLTSLADLPSEAAAERQMIAGLGLNGVVMVPLARRRELVGCVGYGRVSKGRECSAEVISLLKVASEMIVNALERKRVERHRLELALERERVETLQLFISNVSHDLKTPLTVIKSNLYLAQKRDDADKRAYYLRNIEAQADRIDLLLRDLLTLLHLDSSPEFDFQPLDMRDVLGDIEVQLRPLAEQKQLVLTIEQQSAVAEVLADRRQLARVFMNLVQNAISYTPVGHSITIQMYQQADNIVVEVVDTGIGIADTDMPHIFEQFYRAPAAKAISSHGTGLGLSIVARILQMHGGNISVESVEHHGTTFRVWLPVISMKL